MPLAFLIVYELTKSLPASVIAASLILFGKKVVLSIYLFD